MKLEVTRQIFEKYSNINFIRARSVGAELFHSDGRTDMTLIVVFRNFVNAPKNEISFILIEFLLSACICIKYKYLTMAT